MAESLLVRIRQGTARVIEDSLAERATANRFEEMAREAEVAIAECLDIPVSARALWQSIGRSIYRMVERKEIVDWVYYGEWLQKIFDSSLSVFLALRQWVRKAEEVGQGVSNAAQVEEAIADLTRLRSEALDNWPWPPTPEEVAEAVAEYERGDSLPLDEAFAEIAGVTKEEWLARVEERRRELREEGKDLP